MSPHKRTDPKSDQAAAEMYRLAQAKALLRRYREETGQEPESLEALAAWAAEHPTKPWQPPTAADHETVAREHPELALLANRSNRYLSGAN
jgi:hypothetical protein